MGCVLIRSIETALNSARVQVLSFVLPLAYQTLHPLLVISWLKFVLPTGILKSSWHRVVGGFARLDTS